MGRAQFLHPLHIQLANNFNNGEFGYYASHPSFTSASASQSPQQQHQQQPYQLPALRLTPREDSTIVQLQRQRLRDQYAVAGVVSKNIPGFKTSAAFFASLRTNLRLHASPPPSPMSAPQSMTNSATSLPPPSPLSHPTDPTMDPSILPEDPLADVPELTTYLATTDDDKIAALKLVADSIAQMRQNANNTLVWHPLNLAVGVALLALVARYTHEARQDKTVTALTCAGIIMIFLAGFRYLTQGYLFAAEAINWEWLGDADVIVTKFGEEVIGTVVVQWVSGEARGKRKKAWRGEVIGWTVRLRYRKKGVGGALLEEAVREARKKGPETTIEFAEEHANSKRVLPSLYNSAFDKRDRRGRELLADLVEVSPTKGSPNKGRRRRGDSR
ncbi:hypothetical protein LTR01_003438 [Friedmanniomyces endolithicus]|nr:hypothetical protein LTR01_003438 [Friedmanniomyces endolithicus]KAK0828550.1 hypothetical protein LTR73_004859 [Friedmanniomyces endolithicus]